MFNAQHWQLFFASGLSELLRGLLITLGASLLGLVLALILGVIFGVFATSQWKVARAMSRVYVEFFQNTPLILQAIFLGYGLPILWPALLRIPMFMIGVIAVSIYHGAYISEAVRAGIQAINRGQLEASLSQGMTYVQAMRYVVIPQALRIVLPPLTNQAVNLIKNTSVLLVLSVPDLMYQTKLISDSTGATGPAFLVAAVLYFILCFPLARFAKRLEDKAEVTY
ncbi:MAG: amino acid ABC transporter permease [Actinomycetia bacterium]|nr:amino acid ABC transporter permease [Actinomycetes bacterium]